jgi:hypothetical protein
MRAAAAQLITRGHAMGESIRNDLVLAVDNRTSLPATIAGGRAGR